jgi:hypothetical protein
MYNVFADSIAVNVMVVKSRPLICSIKAIAPDRHAVIFPYEMRESRCLLSGKRGDLEREFA